MNYAYHRIQITQLATFLMAVSDGEEEEARTRAAVAAAFHLGPPVVRLGSPARSATDRRDREQRPVRAVWGDARSAVGPATPARVHDFPGDDRAGRVRAPPRSSRSRDVPRFVRRSTHSPGKAGQGELRGLHGPAQDPRPRTDLRIGPAPRPEGPDWGGCRCLPGGQDRLCRLGQ